MKTSSEHNRPSGGTGGPAARKAAGSRATAGDAWHSRNQEHAPNHQEHAPNHQEQAPNHQEHAPNHQEHAPNHQEHAPNHQEHTPTHQEHAHTLTNDTSKREYILVS
ncbi:ell-associated factor Eaf-like [Penaeus chinensis]|uniref:ell-associated factor Eaf-like n=1 Tax=Penaeus chinensis TaxID=139456 RepID=UPI001FB70EE7|nr:ell-associated factor Eaf-like [Penaeus chinensis]